ncbi:MAG: serine hydrolase [Phycisphaerales bacterium]|nr:serine hydrolase [Phycisphaerales bacterium]
MGPNVAPDDAPVPEAVEGLSPRTAARLERALTARFERFRRRNPEAVPGVMLAIRGRVSFSLRLGSIEPGGAPLPRDASMPLGSHGKWVVALGVLRLAGQGRFSLDDPVLDLIGRDPLRPAQWGGFNPSGVTVRRLLNHSAGLRIGNCASLPIDSASPGLGAILRGEAGVGEPAQIEAEPGTRFAYANAGYALLQLGVRQVTGEPLDAWASRELFAPAGCRRLWFGPTPAFRDRAIPGRDWECKPVQARRYLTHSSTGLYGSPFDLADFMARVFGSGGASCGEVGEANSQANAMPIACDSRPVRGGGLVPPQLIGEMLREYGTDARGHRWGLGIMHRNDGGHHSISHGGWRDGWWTFAQCWPSLDRTIIVSGNGWRLGEFARGLGEAMEKAAND